MPWKHRGPAASLPSLLVTTMFSPQGHVLPVSHSPLPWYLRAGRAVKEIWGFLQSTDGKEPESD